MKKRPIIRALLLLLATAISLGGCAASPQTAAPAATEAVQTNTLEVEITWTKPKPACVIMKPQNKNN